MKKHEFGKKTELMLKLFSVLRINYACDGNVRLFQKSIFAFSFAVLAKISGHFSSRPFLETDHLLFLSQSFSNLSLHIWPLF